MKKVMVFGTFDFFHPGHRSFLKQAKKFGNYLIVVIARDVNVVKIKKGKPANSERKRLKMVKDSELAQKVLLGDLKDQYAAIKKYQPDVICLGYDQRISVKELGRNLKKLGLNKTLIKRLKAYKPKTYKSSLLK